MIKLRVGKYYKTTSGSVIQLIERCNGVYKGSNGYTYTLTGKTCIPGYAPDLVQEAKYIGDMPDCGHTIVKEGRGVRVGCTFLSKKDCNYAFKALAKFLGYDIIE